MINHCSTGCFVVNYTMIMNCSVIPPPSFLAEEDFDFIWQDVNVNFPVGAKKGEIRCITIEIVIDDVNEGIEVFTIQLDIIFPFCALYGRAIQTTSGSIQIRIIDQRM